MSQTVVVKRVTSLKPGQKLLMAVTIGVSLIAISLIITIIVLASQPGPEPNQTTPPPAPAPTVARPTVGYVPPRTLAPTIRPAVTTRPTLLTTPAATTRPPTLTPRPTSVVITAANPYTAQGCDTGVSSQPRLTCPANKSISGGNIQYGQWNVADYGYGGVSCGSPNPATSFVTAGMPAGAIGQNVYQLGPITSYSYNPNPGLPANGVSNQYLVKYQCN